MNNLPSPLPHQVNLTTLTDYIRECYFQLFGFYPTDTQDSYYQILSWYFEKYSKYYAKKALTKAAEECVVDYNYTGEFTSKEPLDVEVYVIRSSITDIELPNHD